MSSQSYRGHVIDVTCQSLGDRISYLLSISVRATGETRHQAGSQANSFSRGCDAEDSAFAEARAWIENSPLRWPFATPLEHAR